MSTRTEYRATGARVLLIAAALATGSPLLAQPYPAGTIRVVAAAASGTPPDIISRLIANEITQAQGWRFVIENKVGAMQTLAQTEVLRQPADGYTVLSVSLPGMTAPALLPQINVNLERDFAPVAKLSTSYNVLVVHPSVPVHSVKELVAHLKANPDKLTFSSGGFGTPAHLAGELFKVQTGIKATHVPYNALPQAIANLIGGTHEYMFVTTLPVIELIATGKLRALAVAAPQRLPVLKDVPTMAEAGFPDLVVQDWVGYLVKSGTPADPVTRLNAAINQALAKPSTRDAMAKIGAQPAGGSPEEFGAFVKSQLAYWGKVVRDSGMRMGQ
jgi:tripartite-type tricarboxylate transporter receptor subunit TctC